jgi:hypothetical protein
VNFGSVINTKLREAEPSFTADGKTMYFNCQLRLDRAGNDICVSRLARISHNGIISRTASPDNTFSSLIRGDQHHCHGNRTGNWTPIAAIRLCTSRSPSSQA